MSKQSNLVNTSQDITVDSSGNVGIGTSSPSEPLHVAGGAVRIGNTKIRHDGSGGSWDMAFETYSGGYFERMRIDSSGRVTKPDQPCFVATRNTDHTITITDADIPLDAVDVNIGGHFNTSTYTFTAPIAGRYFFTLQATINNINSGQYNAIYIIKNGVGTGYRFRTLTGSGWTGIQASAILRLSANDNIKLSGYTQTGTMTLQGQEVHFGGYLLG